MIFNLVIDKKKFGQFVKEITANDKVHIIQQMDMLSIMTIETSKKLMTSLMKKHDEIKHVEQDGKVFAI